MYSYLITLDSGEQTSPPCTQPTLVHTEKPEDDEFKKNCYTFAEQLKELIDWGWYIFVDVVYTKVNIDFSTTSSVIGRLRYNENNFEMYENNIIS